MFKPLTPRERRLMEANALVMSGTATDQDKAFLARQLVQATLPHRDPGNVPVWSRVNGSLTMTVQQGYNRDGSPVGHPFGTLPRLLLYWMTTEAIRTKNPKLMLGDSLASFMDQLGLDHRGGGKRSDRVRLQDQMRRLFSARLTFYADVEQGGRKGQMTEHVPLARRTMLWWDQSDPDQTALWNSFVELDREFFDAITANPVPVDLRALRALKDSPLALDLYSLLTWQAFMADRGGSARFMPWRQLQASLGTSYADLRDLRRAIKPALAKIEAVFPSLVLGEREGGIEVLPDSLPAVPSL